MQFTWGDRQRVEQTRQACAEAGVPYRVVRVWRRPVSLGSLFTAIKGARDIRRTVQQWDIDVLMPRSTLPALSALLALRGRSMPMVFDADGLPLDERVDFDGQSSSGLVYRFLRDIEAQGVRRADRVLTRSRRAVEILQVRAGAGVSEEKFHVVGNGRDSTQFQPFDSAIRESTRAGLAIGSEVPLLVYAGSLGDQYCLHEMLQFFAGVRERRPDAHLLILTGSPEKIDPELTRFAGMAQAVTSKTVSPADVPRYLACADAGLALRRKSFSMQGVAPIKLGEYLLCGTPVLATAGIGDTHVIGRAAGYVLQDMSNMELRAAADWFVDRVLPEREGFRGRCRQVGLSNFSLDSTVQAYAEALGKFAR